MKPHVAYAILDTSGKRPTPALTDYRLPIFWVRAVANKYRRDNLGSDFGKVVKVVITESER